jgi:hypothetical protein
MAQIVLSPGLTWAKLPPTQSVQLIDPGALRLQIESMRREWTDAAGDLSKVTCNLGAIFDEFADLVGGEA